VAKPVLRLRKAPPIISPPPMRQTRKDRRGAPEIEPGGVTLSVPNASFAGLLMEWAHRAAEIETSWSRSGYGPVIIRFASGADRVRALAVAREHLAALDRFPDSGVAKLWAAYKESW
jgi:hypothetical protein